MTVLEELKRSSEQSEYSDCWSDAAERVYFGAAAFHGLPVDNEHWRDIYSYAIEAAQALGYGNWVSPLEEP